MKATFGTVSEGTMLQEDLIPAFLDVLEQMDDLTLQDADLVRHIRGNIELGNYYGSVLAADDLVVLSDALNAYAPEGGYFGAHPGDGSNCGFWLSESFAEDFDGLKVSDLSEIPLGCTGEVLHVNDHGNTALYSCAGGKLTEVWAVV